MQNIPAFYGIHIIAEFYGVREDILTEEKTVSDFLFRSLQNKGVHVLNHVSHKFEKAGVTAIALLAESHVSIHTYPEHRSAFIDAFTCGNTEASKAIVHSLQHLFLPEKVNFQCIERGVQVP